MPLLGLCQEALSLLSLNSEGIPVAWEPRETTIIL